MAVWLEVVGLGGGQHSPQSGQRFPLVPGQSVVIGRGRYADIDLENLAISRKHCKIHWDGCRAWLHDLSSPCGTYIHHVRVIEPEGSLLRLGDDILVGPVRLHLGTSSRMEFSWLTWHDSMIPRLAQAIYDDRAFDRLPILADALEEAGCQDQDILGHWRSGHEHVRGCWVLDCLLAQR